MKSIIRVVAAGIALSAVMSQTFAASDRIAMPVYTMGAFNPGSPQSLDVAAKTPKLAFKGVTLARLKELIDDGYEISAQVFGGHVGNKYRYPCYNLQYYPSADAPTMIVGNFGFYETGYAKGICFKLTDGDDGVEITVTDVRNLTNVATTYPFVSLNEDGSLSYGGRAATFALSWSDPGYGAGALQCAKFVPSDGFLLVWPNVTLDDIKNRGIYGQMGGGSDPFGYECTGANTVYDYNDDGNVTNICTELQVLEGTTVKCLVVQLVNGESGVYAKALEARYVRGQAAIGFKFANSDGTYNGSPGAVSTSYADPGYGVYGLFAAHEGITDVSFSTDLAVTSRLVWKGVTLEDVKDLDMGAYVAATRMQFTGGNATGCNKKIIETDEEGKAAKMRVEFQRIDGDKGIYLKCVVAEFTNGVDGVYASYAGSRYVPAGMYSLGGYEFLNEDGSFKTEGDDGYKYNIHGLYATRRITLSEDTDWSSFGLVDLKGEVVDLAGHSLVVNGLEFSAVNNAHINVINNARDSVAPVTYCVFDGDSFANATARFDIDHDPLGAVRLVKKGGGTLVAAATGNNYRGGTSIDEGTLSSAAHGSNFMFGKYDASTGPDIQVNPGAAFNAGSFADYTFNTFVMNGGTYEETDYDCPVGWAQLKSMKLTDDSFMLIEKNHGFNNRKYGACTLDLGGHTLTVNIAAGKIFSLINTTVLNGTLDIASGGSVKTEIYATNAQTADLLVSAALQLDTDLSVRNYVARHTGDDVNSGTAVLSVYGTFRPESTLFYGPTMQDGSTMDFSAWPEAFPVASQAGGGNTEIGFASGAEIAVTLGGQKQALGKILEWTSVPDATFVRCDDDASYRLEKRADGLYAVTGMVIVIQ